MSLSRSLGWVRFGVFACATGVCLSITAARAQGRLSWVHPYPLGQNFLDISVAPTGEAFAITEGGLLVRYLGGRFDIFDTGLYGSSAAVYAVTRNSVYVSLEDIVLRFDGQSFDELPSAEGLSIHGMWADSSGMVVAVGDIGGDFGGIYRFKNGAWIVDRAFEDPPFESVFGFTSRQLYVVGSQGTLLRYDGQEWMPMDVPTSYDLHDIHGASPNTLYAVGDARTMLRLQGNEWVEVVLPPGVGENLIGVFAAGSSVWGAFSSGRLLWLDGAGWRELPALNELDLRAIRGDSAGARVYAVGELGNFVEGIRESFRSRSINVTSAELFSAAKVGSNEAVWVGSSGTIVRTAGADVRLEHTTTKDELIAVHGLASNDIYASGASGFIVHFDGSSWKVSRSPERADCEILADCEFISGIREVAPNWVYAVGYSPVRGAVFLRFDGNVWRYFSPVPEPAGIPIAIWSSAPNNLFIVGTAGMVLHYDGLSWKEVTLSDYEDIIAVQGNNLGRVYALTPSTLYAYKGGVWEPQAVNPSPEDLGDFITLAVTPLGRAYVATQAGAVLVLEDDGFGLAAWVPVWPIYSLLGASESELFVSGTLGNIILYRR